MMKRSAVMTQGKRPKKNSKQAKEIQSMIESCKYDVERIVREVPEESGVSMKEYSITTFVKGNKRLIPFLRVTGEMEEDLRIRSYFFIGVIPPVGRPVFMSTIKKILSDNKTTIDGIVLFDSVNKSIIEMTTAEVDQLFKRR